MLRKEGDWYLNESVKVGWQLTKRIGYRSTMGYIYMTLHVHDIVIAA